MESTKVYPSPADDPYEFKPNPHDHWGLHSVDALDDFHPVHDHDLDEIDAIDPYAKVSERLDPLGEIDPSYELLQACADWAYQMQQDYDGIKNFPEGYLAGVYEREISYIKYGLEKLHELIRLNEDQSIPLKEVNVLFDFDRSQVALVDPIRKKIQVPKEIRKPQLALLQGENERLSDEEISPPKLTLLNGGMANPVDEGQQMDEAAGQEMEMEWVTPPSTERHQVRPGWATLVRLMEQELRPLGIHFSIGALSDRGSQANGGSPERIFIDIANEHFDEAGIEEFVDPSLVQSSTDGPVAKRLPYILQSEMGKGAVAKNKNGDYARPSNEELQATEMTRKKIIASISTPDLLANPKLHYHEKVGTVWGLVSEADPGAAFMLIDDISSVSIMHSPQALGVYLPEDFRPLLPDDYDPLFRSMLEFPGSD
jgi:hypothetical protein